MTSDLKPGELIGKEVEWRGKPWIVVGGTLDGEFLLERTEPSSSSVMEKPAFAPNSEVTARGETDDE